MKLLSRLLILFVVLFAAAGGTAWWLAFKPNIGDDKGEQFFVNIPTGSNLSDVIQILENKKVLLNSKTFSYTAQLRGYDQSIKPGRYLLFSEMSNWNLVGMLRAGHQVPVKLVLAYIKDLPTLAGKVSRSLELDSADLVTQLLNPQFLSEQNLDSQNVISLFLPDTYEFWWNTNVDQFVERMVQENEKFWSSDNRSKKADSLALSKWEVYTLASIAMLETNKPEDLLKIAGVYYNRLKKGIQLQADPTLKFANNLDTVRRILNKDKKIDSPYNTYKYKGLPPGPIYMASKQAIDAVLNHPPHNYLFFCAKADFSGYSAFAVTYREHLVNARKYQKALDDRGIKR